MTRKEAICEGRRQMREEILVALTTARRCPHPPAKGTLMPALPMCMRCFEDDIKAIRALPDEESQ